MNRFSEKLTELRETLDLVLAYDHMRLGEALHQSANTLALAVGSGGSAVVATYFRRCRETLLGGETITMTPMELVVSTTDLRDTDVWLFSAGAENPDFKAALQAACVRRARRIHVVTRRPDVSKALGLGDLPNISAYIVPVANQKDGFLATHSLVSSVSALLLASNLVSNDPVPELATAFEEAALDELDEEKRRRAMELFSTLQLDDTLLIIADPQIAPVASLIETSTWEAAICAVQLTDFRNFAHGRHTWLYRRPDKTIILALTGHDSAEFWVRAHQVLPTESRQINADFGNCGRFANAAGILRGLVWVEAMGCAVGIDPGRPGLGEFGRPLYQDASLERLAHKLGSAVRQKRQAKLEHDNPSCNNTEIHAAGRDWLMRLAAAPIKGIIFDYDGTIVPTDQRGSAPADDIVNELMRLHKLGVQLAVATGRGGSAGEKLRDALPVGMQSPIIIGYYNGAYVRPLDIDIREEPPPIEPVIAQTVDWLAGRNDLFVEPITSENSRVQITLQLENILDLEKFYREIVMCDSVASGAVRITRSGHSVDLILAGTSKSHIADYLEERLGADAVILRVGDKGARGGNDNELLTHSYGISVHEVCGRDDGCWSLFGSEHTGPDALLRLLKSLKPDQSGDVCIDLECLGLDSGLE